MELELNGLTLKTSKYFETNCQRCRDCQSGDLRVVGDVEYTEFFFSHLLPNKPCILSSTATSQWKSRQEWVDNHGKPDLVFLENKFGDATVPVANCKTEEFGSHCKKEMKMRDYLQYWRDYTGLEYPADMPCLYLKDWHFTRDFPSYTAYNTPCYFLSDWLNEFWDTRSDDDYRFVYMGPKGTWTPFHADVFRSFSWSANICGRKKWIFVPPGKEECYKDKFGNLVYDVTSEDLKDKSKFPNYNASEETMVVIQEQGEIIYVPSGWHHQVYNLEDTISINHNWLNGCNVDICWNFIKSNLADVQREITDCQDMEGWHDQCQLILKASSGIDYSEFYQFMLTIATHRLDWIKNKTSASSESLFCSNCDIELEHSGTLQSGKSHLAPSVSDDGKYLCQNCVLLLQHKELREKDESQEMNLCDEDCDDNSLAENEQNANDKRLLNHAEFDLLKVLAVVEDMINNKEFNQLEIKASVQPDSLIEMIKSVVKN